MGETRAENRGGGGRCRRLIQGFWAACGRELFIYGDDYEGGAEGGPLREREQKKLSA